jgi:hypothetical protein
MADCKYCGKPAGFLHHEHKDCARAHEEGRAEIARAIAGAFASPELPLELPRSISVIAEKSHVAGSEQRGLLVDGWAYALDQFLDHGVIDEEQQTKLAKFRDIFTLSRDELDAGGAYTRAARAVVLREVMHGRIPQAPPSAATLPINFLKTEQVVWIFRGARYLEDKTRRAYVGSSAGVSVRVMKGVYLHQSAFKGHPVEHTERVLVDTGLFVITTQNLYFSGPVKSLRIPYKKIVSFLPFSDGFGVVRDAASAKPQIFVTSDGWFTYNLVTNLAKL